MKHKIIYALTTATLAISAFLIGRNTTNWADSYCNSSLEITDWNTDGNELSMVLSDGREIYAYKQGIRTSGLSKAMLTQQLASLF